MNGIYVWMMCMYEWNVYECCLCVCINEWCTRMSAHMYMSDVHMWARVPQNTCGGQKTTSSFFWVLRIQIRLACLCCECLQPLSCVASFRLLTVTVEGNSFWSQPALSCTVALCLLHATHWRISSQDSCFLVLPVLWEIWLLDNSFTLAAIVPAVCYKDLDLNLSR